MPYIHVIPNKSYQKYILVDLSGCELDVNETHELFKLILEKRILYRITDEAECQKQLAKNKHIDLIGISNAIDVSDEKFLLKVVECFRDEGLFELSMGQYQNATIIHNGIYICPEDLHKLLLKHNYTSVDYDACVDNLFDPIRKQPEPQMQPKRLDLPAILAKNDSGEISSLMQNLFVNNYSSEAAKSFLTQVGANSAAYQKSDAAVTFTLTPSEANKFRIFVTNGPKTYGGPEAVVAHQRLLTTKPDLTVCIANTMLYESISGYLIPDVFNYFLNDQNKILLKVGRFSLLEQPDGRWFLHAAIEDDAPNYFSEVVKNKIDYANAQKQLLADIELCFLIWLVQEFRKRQKQDEWQTVHMHCRAGMHRSPFMAALFLLIYKLHAGEIQKVDKENFDPNELLQAWRVDAGNGFVVHFWEAQFKLLAYRLVNLFFSEVKKPVFSLNKLNESTLHWYRLVVMLQAELDRIGEEWRGLMNFMHGYASNLKDYFDALKKLSGSMQLPDITQIQKRYLQLSEWLALLTLPRAAESRFYMARVDEVVANIMRNAMFPDFYDKVLSLGIPSAMFNHVNHLLYGNYLYSGSIRRIDPQTGEGTFDIKRQKKVVNLFRNIYRAPQLDVIDYFRSFYSRPVQLKGKCIKAHYKFTLGDRLNFFISKGPNVLYGSDGIDALEKMIIANKSKFVVQVGFADLYVSHCVAMNGVYQPADWIDYVEYLKNKNTSVQLQKKAGRFGIYKALIKQQEQFILTVALEDDAPAAPNGFAGFTPTELTLLWQYAGEIAEEAKQNDVNISGYCHAGSNRSPMVMALLAFAVELQQKIKKDETIEKLDEAALKAKLQAMRNSMNETGSGFVKSHWEKYVIETWQKLFDANNFVQHFDAELAIKAEQILLLLQEQINVLLEKMGGIGLLRFFNVMPYCYQNFFDETKRLVATNEVVAEPLEALGVYLFLTDCKKQVRQAHSVNELYEIIDRILKSPRFQKLEQFGFWCKRLGMLKPMSEMSMAIFSLTSNSVVPKWEPVVASLPTAGDVVQVSPTFSL